MKNLIKYIAVISIMAAAFCLKLFQLTNMMESNEKLDQDYNRAQTIELHADNAQTVSSSAVTELPLYSTSAVLIDGTSGRVLYGKDENRLMPMASTTKIMTCICALEYADLSDTVVISKKAASQPKVHLGVQEGEQYRLEDLLYSLMLESHNDAAVAIAEHVSGSVEEFAKQMNQKALDIGCYQTFFVTPNGLDATVTLEDGTVLEHHTTAENLAKIMRYCIMDSPKTQEFLNITRAKNAAFSELTTGRSFAVSNHNAFLDMMPGALTGKTGFTNKAGYCYVGALQQEERTFIVALLACGWPNHKTYKWTDTKLLMNYGLSDFHWKEKNLETEQLQFPTVSVENSSCFSDEYTEIQALPNFSLFQALKADNEKETVTYELPEVINAPVNKGDVIGTLTYSINGDVIQVFSLCADRTVEKYNYQDTLDRMFLMTMDCAVR